MCRRSEKHVSDCFSFGFGIQNKKKNNNEIVGKQNTEQRERKNIKKQGKWESNVRTHKRGKESTFHEKATLFQHE